MSARIVLFCCFLLIFLNSALGELRPYKWEVEYMHWAPDCVESVVMGINGHFPGPTIRANVGDTIKVELVNKLHTEGVVIHWHGIRQQKTPWADGTASISQCPINPGDTFVYEFIVDKAGTYFYHGHYGMQRAAGLYGSLIVMGQNEPFHYNKEFTLLLSDWWHRSSREQEVDLSSRPFRWIGEPQSLLINGRGQYNCSLSAQSRNSSSSMCIIGAHEEQCAPQILHVDPNQTYRLRVASTTSLSSLNLAIGNHKMKVVEADGNYVEQFDVDNMDIYSGDSYSVIFKTDQDPSKNYWISVSVRGREPKTPQGLAILHYSTASESELPTSPPPIPPAWNDYEYSKTFSKKILALEGSPKPPTTYDRRFVFLNSQIVIDGYTKWAINNVSLTLPPIPYLGSLKHNLKNAVDTDGSGLYMLSNNIIVDIILQNTLNASVSEIHPWHLHAHDFWVLGYGEGIFADEDEKNFILTNPPLRNTVVLFPSGWTAIRFVTDNPGVWAFHCHIEAHLHLGMGVVFAEAVELVGYIPPEALKCMY